MGRKTYNNIQLADPFLRPYWRYTRVLAMMASMPPERCRRYDDEWIRGYRKFLISWQNENNREALKHENPGLFFAHSIHNRIVEDPDMGLIIEGRLLTGETVENIADSIKTIPETIQWYEKIFFSVQDFLTHPDWILKQVLLPAIDRFVIDPEDDSDTSDPDPVGGIIHTPKSPVPPIAKPHFDMSLKFFAYFGGPKVCDLMLSGFRPDMRVTSYDEIHDFFNEQFAVQIKRRSAQVAGLFDINRYNVMELFAVHTKLIEIQRAVDKDPAQKHNEFERNLIAMLDALPFASGKAGKDMYEGTLIGKVDSSAAEMSDEELLTAGAGEEFDVSEMMNLQVGVKVIKKPETVKKTKGKQ